MCTLLRNIWTWRMNCSFDRCFTHSRSLSVNNVFWSFWIIWRIRNSTHSSFDRKIWHHNWKIKMSGSNLYGSGSIVDLVVFIHGLVKFVFRFLLHRLQQVFRLVKETVNMKALTVIVAELVFALLLRFIINDQLCRLTWIIHICCLNISSSIGFLWHTIRYADILVLMQLYRLSGRNSSLFCRRIHIFQSIKIN